MDTRDKQGQSIELFDGMPAILRPILPGDAEALLRFHANLSPATVHRRFFGYHPILTIDEVRRFTHVDGTDRVAFVVSTSSELIAVGRYERDGTAPEAEVAFVVADAYQRHGLGSLLFERLAQRARVFGIERFTAETLAENGAMLAVFRDSGYPLRSTVGAGVVDVTLDIGALSSNVLSPQPGTDHASSVPPSGPGATVNVPPSFSALPRRLARPNPPTTDPGSNPTPSSTISRDTRSSTVTVTT
jgi:GNAT superfamily N-acetyltransferase